MRRGGERWGEAIQGPEKGLLQKVTAAGDHRLQESHNLRPLSLTQGTMDPKSGQTSRSGRQSLKGKMTGQRVTSARGQVLPLVLLGNKVSPYSWHRTPHAWGQGICQGAESRVVKAWQGPWQKGSLSGFAIGWLQARHEC